MKAALYAGEKNIKVEDLILQNIGDDDLLIKVGACGICGTDFHIYNGEAPAKVPIVIGHEYAGEIAEIGKNVMIDMKVSAEDFATLNITSGFSVVKGGIMA